MGQMLAEYWMAFGIMGKACIIIIGYTMVSIGCGIGLALMFFSNDIPECEFVVGEDQEDYYG